MVVDGFFQAQLEEAIKTIRAWDGLTRFGKMRRLEKKPSEIDYRIFSLWMKHLGAIDEEESK